MTIISPLARRNRNQGQIEKASLRKEPVEFAIFNHNNHPGHRCRHNHYHHHPRPQIMIMRWLLNVRNRLVIGHGGDLLWYNGRLPLRVVKEGSVVKLVTGKLFWFISRIHHLSKLDTWVSFCGSRCDGNPSDWSVVVLVIPTSDHRIRWIHL